MISVQLVSGCWVNCEYFQIESLYSGFLECWPKGVARLVRANLPRQLREQFGEAAFVILDPGSEVLPDYVCKARFRSSPVHNGTYSDLVLCWFIDSPQGDFETTITSPLELVDWEKQARDVEIDFSDMEP